MSEHDWQKTTESLLRDWLGVHFPLSELGGLIPDIAAVFGVTGGPNEGMPGAPHFQHFTTALKQFGEWQEKMRGQSLDPGEAVRAWLSVLRVEAQRIGPLFEAEVAPILLWLDAQSHPILGHARELHAKWAAVARAAAAHFRALLKWHAMLRECLPAAVERLDNALEDAAQPSISNARELFQLWTACADAAYREMAFTDRHALVFAECVNSGSQLRLAWSNWQRDGARTWFGVVRAPAYPPPHAARATATDSAETSASSTAEPRAPNNAAKAVDTQGIQPLGGGVGKAPPVRKYSVPKSTRTRSAASPPTGRVRAKSTTKESPPKVAARRETEHEFDIAGISRPTEH